MKTDIAIEKLINIAPIIYEMRDKIKADADFIDAIKNMRGETVDNVGFVLKVVPMILKSYRAEMYDILAIVFDKDVEEIKEQNLGKTINEIKELLSDEDFKGFFSAVLATDTK